MDRLGPRVVRLISIVLLDGLAPSLALLTPHLWRLCLVFAALPICAGGATPLGYSAVLVRRFERHLGLALGLALMGVGLGATIIPPLAQTLVGGFGWRQAYAMIGGICLVVGVSSALIATRNTRGPVIRQAGIRKLLDRVQAPRLLTALALLAGAAFLLLAFGEGRPSGYCAAFLLGGVMGAEVDFIAFLIRRHFVQELFGRFYGIALPESQRTAPEACR